MTGMRMSSCYTLKLHCSGRKQASSRSSQTHPHSEGKPGTQKPDTATSLKLEQNSPSTSNRFRVQGSSSRGKAPIVEGQDEAEIQGGSKVEVFVSSFQVSSEAGFWNGRPLSD